MSVIQFQGKTSTFRVQVADEGEYGDQTWRDDLKKLLEEPVQRN